MKPVKDCNNHTVCFIDESTGYVEAAYKKQTTSTHLSVGDSVKTLSEKAGISKSYLDYIESGAREPQVEVLAKIAVILDSPLETMLDIQKKEQMQAAIARCSYCGKWYELLFNFSLPQIVGLCQEDDHKKSIEVIPMNKGERRRPFEASQGL